MYYRVAIRVDPSSHLRWKSTVLGSLNTLLQWFRFYRTFPQDQLRVFSSSSREGLAEQFEQENNRLACYSVAAAHFLRAGTPEYGVGAYQPLESIAVTPDLLVQERSREETSLVSGCMGTLERRRAELESGPGGDHDIPYKFCLPPSLPQALAWVVLLVRAQQGELQP